MIMLDKIKAQFIKEKPQYGKVVALTAVGVALVEGAAFLGFYIAKKIHASKIEDQINDEGFELSIQQGDVSVEFEAEDKTEQ